MAALSLTKYLEMILETYRERGQMRLLCNFIKINSIIQTLHQ